MKLIKSVFLILIIFKGGKIKKNKIPSLSFLFRFWKKKLDIMEISSNAILIV